MHLSCKIFPDMGHVGLIGENTERFLEKADVAKKEMGFYRKTLCRATEKQRP